MKKQAPNNLIYKKQPVNLRLSSAFAKSGGSARESQKIEPASPTALWGPGCAVLPHGGAASLRAK